MTVTRSAPTTAQRNSTLAIICLSLGSLAFSALQSLVAPALRTIGQDLHATSGSVSWILTAYLLSASMFTPILGRLADLIGKRRVLIIALILLLAGTVLAAVAPNIGILIIGRAIQGAAGVILPLSIAIAREVVPPERVSAAIGLLSAIFGVGGGIGILAAGPILESLSWQWLFWLPAVLIVLALVGTIIGIPDSPVSGTGRVDLLGSGILGAALVAILIAFSEGQSWGWASARILGLLAVGVVALIAFVIVELRIKYPLIDVRTMRIRGVWTAHAVALMAGFGMFALFILIPTLLETPASSGFGFGATATQAGLVLLPAVITMVVFSALAGILIRRLGPKPPMLIGSIALTAAFAISAVSHTEIWLIALNVALAGAGIGFALASIANAIVEAVPATQTAEALSTNTIARTIGSSIGTAVVAAALATHSASHAGPSSSGLTAGFWISAAVAALSIVVTLFVPSAMRSLPPTPALPR